MNGDKMQESIDRSEDNNNFDNNQPKGKEQRNKEAQIHKENAKILTQNFNSSARSSGFASACNRKRDN